MQPLAIPAIHTALHGICAANRERKMKGRDQSAA
jgi:hypothetical protein